MAEWPKMIMVRGLSVPINSWAELRELADEFGGEAVGPTNSQPSEQQRTTGRRSTLSPPDRQMLNNLVQYPRGGMLNSELGSALGVQGQEIRPKLDEWARRIGLAYEDGSAFEAVNRGRAGRGYRLTEFALGVAKGLLNPEGGSP